MVEARDATAAAALAAAALAGARRRLAATVADLEGELAAVAEATAEGPDDEHDAEGSTVGFERARVGGLLAAARQELVALDEAGRRLAAGTYRRCEGCGGDIGAERLAAMPATRRCVGCAAAAGRVRSPVRAAGNGAGSSEGR